MDPTAPAPLTRAAARSRAAVRAAERATTTPPAATAEPVDRIGLARTIALAGGAVGGACIVLVVASLLGISSLDAPLEPESKPEQVSVTVPPRAATTKPAPSPSPTAVPTPSAHPSESPVPLPDAPVEADAVPDPEPSETADPVAPEETSPDTAPGKSASAPGRNKPPKP